MPPGLAPGLGLRLDVLRHQKIGLPIPFPKPRQVRQVQQLERYRHYIGTDTGLGFTHLVIVSACAPVSSSVLVVTIIGGAFFSQG